MLVAFESAFAFTDDDTNGVSDVFVKDLDSDDVVRVSLSPSPEAALQQGNGRSYAPALNENGSLVAFLSKAGNFISGPASGHVHLFVRDRKAGETVWLSQTESSYEANGVSSGPGISADGHRVVFSSSAATWWRTILIRLRMFLFLTGLSTGSRP